jgi:hypothetical protein
LPTYLESTFNRETFDLRDKAIVRVDREAVNTIEITSEGRTIGSSAPTATGASRSPSPRRLTTARSTGSSAG